jgi:hypothetical protein
LKQLNWYGLHMNQPQQESSLKWIHLADKIADLNKLMKSFQ